MAKKNGNLLSGLNAVLFGESIPKEFKRTTRYDIGNSSPVIFSTNNREEYEAKKLRLKQQKLLSYQWVKSGVDNMQDNLAGLTGVKLMYRDADLMCSDTYISSALEIVSDETCCVNSKGKMINIYSKSERIKSILEDLFVNRLDINTMLPAICYNMLKYGNEYMLLNINLDEGITGWREIPPYDMERYESGMDTPYTSPNTIMQNNTFQPEETKFVRIGKNEGVPYRNWQVAHFRYLTDTFFLPYGVSYIHKARRAWRMLSMMEDSMLIHRLDKSVERRVFKIYVGAIDEQDVPAYVQEVANNFKRTPLIDPATGQLDLKKGYADVTSDYFIPVRSENAPNPIETLSSAQYSTAMDDIEYMRNKVLAALRIPKAFLNFQESAGKGQNLSIMDIRFCRMVNRAQQFLIMELNKIAIEHLYLLGFEDELTNFSITMNNPSPQIEAQELDDITKRATVAAQLLADPGNGIQIWSLHRVLKEVMKMTDKEIADNLNEIRLEKALAAELGKTEQIIQRTGLFDPIDNIYGEIGAEYQSTGGSGEEGGMGGPGGGGGGSFGAGLGGDMGGDDLGGEVDSLGAPGGETGGDISGAAGSTDMAGAPAADAGMPMEGAKKNKPLLLEKTRQKNEVALPSIIEKRIRELNEKDDYDNERLNTRVDFISNNLILNETTQSMLDELSNRLMEIDNEDIESNEN
jgi:uncharacterized membrane protein YgcG